MALPELFAPTGTPCFMLAGHGVDPDPLHDDVDFAQGHGLSRQLFTTAPRTAHVSLDLSEAQAAAYDEWFEESLDVGVALFTAEIASIGAGSRYWAAQWVAPPTWEPRQARNKLTGGLETRWRVSGQLLLTGEGSDTPPLGATLATEYVLELTGSGRVTSGVKLATEYELELSGRLPLASEYELELLQVIPTYFEREDSGYIQREDGTPLQRE